MLPLIGIAIGYDYIDLQLYRLFLGRRASRLKRDALIFDRIAIPGLQYFFRQFERRFHHCAPGLPQHTQDLIRSFYSEIEYLMEAGLLFDPSVNAAVLREYDSDYWQIRADAGITRDPSLYFLDVREIEEDLKYELRMPALEAENDYHILRGTAMHLADKGNCHPIPMPTMMLSPPERFGLTLASAEAVRIVLAHVPAPTDLTPWEEILSFRNDAESRRRFLKLRRWMRRVAGAGRAADDIEEELRDLLNDYDIYYRKHIANPQFGACQGV